MLDKKNSTKILAVKILKKGVLYKNVSLDIIIKCFITDVCLQDASYCQDDS